MQDDQKRLIREDDINQKVHPFTFAHHYRSFVLKQNSNQTVCEIYLWCLLPSKFLWCTP